jgi:hypothetical protein
MKLRPAPLLAVYLALLSPGPARAQSFPLPDFGGKSGPTKEGTLPGGLGDVIG